MHDCNYAHTHRRGLTVIQYACKHESVLLSEHLFHCVIISNINLFDTTAVRINRNSIINAVLGEIIASIARKTLNVKLSARLIVKKTCSLSRKN